jgi:hypothetical protein
MLLLWCMPRCMHTQQRPTCCAAVMGGLHEQQSSRRSHAVSAVQMATGGGSGRRREVAKGDAAARERRNALRAVCAIIDAFHFVPSGGRLEPPQESAPAAATGAVAVREPAQPAAVPAAPQLRTAVGGGAEDAPEGAADARQGAEDGGDVAMHDASAQGELAAGEAGADRSEVGMGDDGAGDDAGAADGDAASRGAGGAGRASAPSIQRAIEQRMLPALLSLLRQVHHLAGTPCGRSCMALFFRQCAVVCITCA